MRNGHFRQIFLGAISMAGLLLSFACEPGEKAPASPVEEFKALLAERRMGVEVPEADLRRFTELIRMEAEVRKYIVDQFPHMTEIQQGDTFLAIQFVSREAPLLGLEELVCSVARNPDSLPRLTAIYCLEFYEHPDREAVLRSILQSRPVRDHFSDFGGALEVYLKLYGAAAITEHLDAALAAQLMQEDQLALAGDIVKFAEPEHTLAALTRINDLFDQGVAEKRVHRSSGLLLDLIKVERKGDERLKAHVIKFTNSRQNELKQAAMKFMRHFYNEG